jgi:predicted AlkP superfamily pyrophosphatase or phosphodiesterase
MTRLIIRRTARPRRDPGRRPLPLLALLLAASLSLPALAAAYEHLLIVSIDALHPRALDAEVSPTLHALMQGGRYTLEGRSVSPPKTLIAHTAMLTGLTPERSGKLDNDWRPGEPRVGVPTLFDDAKGLGYATAYYFSKTKLGYLVGPGVDTYALAPEDGVALAEAFLRAPGRRFVYLHISGLENAGSRSGWLSEDYLDTLSSIDLALSPLLEVAREGGDYLILVTSDHAGHDREHGTEHPDDYRLPLILAASRDLPPLPSGPFPITEVRGLVKGLLASAPTPGTPSDGPRPASD